VTDERPGWVAEGWCPRRTPQCGSHADRHGLDVVAVVVHYTGGGPLGPLVRWLCSQPSPGVSYHAIIDRDGSATQLVDLRRAAQHAGEAELDGEGKVNSRTIGVALCNHGPLRELGGDLLYTGDGSVYAGPRAERAEHMGTTALWEPYADPQIRTLRKLLDWLRHTGWPARLVGHDGVAVPYGRKLDPGPLFPWGDFGRVTL
jgi:N-acetyl-anhydromuramyl-L-alanine amidase AmpD